MQRQYNIDRLKVNKIVETHRTDRSKFNTIAEVNKIVEKHHRQIESKHNCRDNTTQTGRLEVNTSAETMKTDRLEENTIAETKRLEGSIIAETTQHIQIKSKHISAAETYFYIYFCWE